MIFDQGFLPPALDRPVSNCKSAVLVWSAPGIIFPRYPPYLVNIPLSATGGGARWNTSNYIALQWYGYVQRMEEGRLPKEVMKWSPPGRRKRGRPKATWAEGIRGLVGGKGLIVEDWKDRDKWKKK